MPSKFQTLYQNLAQAIRSGQFKKGDKLPSVRKLSQTYGCSKDTAQRALLELKYQNLIYAVPKSGYYVLEGKDQDSDNLAISLEAYNKLAYQDFKTCLSETLVGRENYLFNYYHQQEGLAELLSSLQDHLLEQDIYSKIENLVVTSGTQQALYILTQMAFPNQKPIILLEQPTYHRMNSLVRNQGLPYLTIDRDFSGLDLERLEKLLQSHPIKFFYTIPRISNPLGLSYSSQEKQALVDLAHRYDVYIIEDDYMGDFTKSENLPLHYYDTHERVIYLKSFSTTLFPALRLGMSVLPQKLMHDFLAYKKLMDYDTSLIMQKALSLYLDNGMFAKNLSQLKHFFEQRLDQATDLCQTLPDYLSCQIGPKHISIKLPKKLKLGRFKERGIQTLDPATRVDQYELPYLYLANDQTLAKKLKTITQILKTL
ncbi:GntR family aminotransferase [Streptococcus criceti]|uniref:Transcriptional regulator, GntR family n=1 Tax=Streptococcus criceti HS-6 TaxID=873449 RepID=G5JMZ3_STRCG|nr:PLP-dependent aminotransferase family protein [Streptococcus criceti]EHI73637.1 transcriptional regulator, GntR family [Streptococcus criceti HS-6]SUN38850.1 GntR family aminotransferase [Streptococcus criceti]